MDDRYFSPDPAQRAIAHGLYEQVKNLPLICPHGHVDPFFLVHHHAGWIGRGGGGSGGVAEPAVYQGQCTRHDQHRGDDPERIRHDSSPRMRL